MTVPASPWQFVLPPAADPAPHAGQINTALKAYRAFLDAAVAEPPDYAVFRAADELFRRSCKNLAENLPVAGVDNPNFFEAAWGFNLAAGGMATTGTTAQAVKEQLGALEARVGLARQLAYRPDSSWVLSSSTLRLAGRPTACSGNSGGF